MTKLNFLFSLRDRLSGLPQKDVEERLSFYSEMMEDRMEEGLSEEEAVAAVGSVEEIVAQIIAEIPPVREKSAPKRSARQFKAWEIVLLVLGSPLWFSLLIAAFATVISLVASVWAVFASLAACTFAGAASGIVFLLTGNAAAGMAMIAAGLVCAGLSIYLFFGCKAVTNGTVRLVKKTVTSIRKEKTV